MRFSLKNKRISHLNVQRNFLIGLVSILLMIVLLQAIFLFLKKERIVISPPELKQSYWIEGDRFAKSYLEEWALFFTHLIMDVSEKNILPQGEILLRYVSSHSYGDFKAKLLEDEKRLKKQQLSIRFEPQATEFIDNMTVDITGVLVSYVGSQKISEAQEVYRVSFSQKKGRLFLESFQLIKTNQGNKDDEDPKEH